jgi:hypothetical protein
MGLTLKQLSPLALWETFDRFVSTKRVGTLHQAASVENYANDVGYGGDLYHVTQRLVESLADIIRLFGRHHWGLPDHAFTRDRRDSSAPAKKAPQWLEQHLYRGDVPARLYRVVGWDRQRERGESVIGFVCVAEHPGEEARDWQFVLMFGVLAPEEWSGESISRRRRMR